MDLIVFLFKSSWKALSIALFTGVVSGGCSAGLIALISKTAAEPGTPPGLLAIFFVALGIVALFTAMLSRILLIRFSQSAVFELQMQLSRQILATELKPLETIGLPRLLVVLTEDVQAIATAAGVVPMLIINIASAAGCMLYISWLSWQVLALVAVLTLVASVSCRWFLVAGWRGLNEAREHQDRLFQHFRTLIDGIKELKLHPIGQQDFLEADLSQTALQLRKANERGMSQFAVVDSWGKFIYFFAVGLILFALPYWIGISLETRFGYLLTFTYVLGPMESLVNKIPFLSRASIALQKIKSLGLTLSNTRLATGSTVVKSSTAPLASDSWHQLTLKETTHAYRTDQGDREFTLGPINLTVHPGELIFIIGGNGSGKSTLAKLLTGLYSPQSGTIHLDDQLITAQNQNWYRQHFSVVFSDFYLFERLLGFSESSDDRQAQAYLAKLQLDHKVSISRGRFSTTNLSQGQRKRLTLLSAYLEDRPIYLFDEWAADQDPTFKDIFYTQFLTDLKAKGRTLFVISHDDRYFHLADRIIKLDYGSVTFDQAPTPQAYAG
ncbi:cyclic peptide transporter subfamily [Synechococcus sp. PCC 7335]|uniref:cyclic peptide export ABC transporter n=1 Tax=Synechococcus sp. (strain ATCC 29403 / PCC 7335) TaxID=91464 RepID=UPI00017ECA7C|nr:cyclic peptide export ABC transporter [Synechococcus sp. PCC 7335]EDX83845.1 cyclic peptide transporter subfamily [Synechococcus sp. PCC 7335]